MHTNVFHNLLVINCCVQVPQFCVGHADNARTYVQWKDELTSRDETGRDYVSLCARNGESYINRCFLLMHFNFNQNIFLGPHLFFEIREL